MCRFIRLVAAAAFTVAIGHECAPPARAQSATLLSEKAALQRPRFLLAIGALGTQTRPLDIDRTPSLSRRIAVDLDGATLGEALDVISERAGFRIGYAADVVERAKVVHLRAQSITVAAALTDVLTGSGVDVVFTSSGGAALVKRPPPPAVGTLVGRVSDSRTGVGVQGAIVTVEGPSIRAATDENGNFRVANVPAGTQTITVRRLGYAPQTRRVQVTDGIDSTVSFSLEAAAHSLEDVVTTATGEQRRVEVGNVIGTIAADSIVRTGSITQLSDLLTARVPGTQVVLSGGYSGMTPTIRIRGLSSISLANDPLIVVDGVRVANTSAALGVLNPRGGFGIFDGRLNDINPDEIESIDVVKGPSAATLYGTDAANGVIVIKTKRGSNAAPNWIFYSEVGTVAPAMNFLDNYYSWGHSPTGAIQQCTLDLAAAKTCTIDSLTTFNQLQNPITSPFGTGLRQEYGAQVRGGTSNLTYFLAAARDYERGYLDLPDGERQRIETERGGATIPDEQLHPNYVGNVRLRGNVGIPLGPKAEVSVATGLILNETSIPNFMIFQSGQRAKGYSDPTGVWGTSRPGEAFAVRNKENNSHLTASLTAGWRPFTWLSTRATSGVDLSRGFLDALQRRNEGPLGANRNGRRQNVRSALDLYSADVGASASFPSLSGWSSRSSVGIQYNRKLDQYTMTLGTGLAPGSETITGASVITGSEQNLESVVAGAYAEQTLGKSDRLFLTGAIRSDGGSTFGSDFNTAIYPKVSASWVAIPQQSGFINTFRLRSAYGSSGVQPGGTAALTLEQLITVFAEGNSAPGAIPSTVGNSGLKPERSSEFEGGFDADLLQRFLSVEFTYYRKLSRDALIQYRLPSEAGVGIQWRNLGAVLNRGIEGLVTIRPIQRQAATLDITLNGSVNTNRIEKLGFNQPVIANDGLNVVGYPLFSRFARPILSYADANGNGIIEPSEITLGPTPVFQGASLPSRELSVTTALILMEGRLTVSSQFDHRGGFLQRNLPEANRCSPNIADCRAANDPNASLASQAAKVALNSFNSRWGYGEDGSFTRLRELAISAHLPASWLSRFNVKAATISVAGRNLLLFTRYTGYDPETNGNIGLAGFGEGFNDGSGPPQSRYWLLRFTLGQ